MFSYASTLGGSKFLRIFELYLKGGGMPQPPKNTKDFSALLEVVKALRGPDGCPWDKEQEHSTLTRYAIEEAFELSEAIDQDDTPALIEELGDLLFQVALHAEIARQEERFAIEEVIEGICEKMIRRHPHVFSDVKVSGTTEVIANWSQIKAAEKAAKAAGGAAGAGGGSDSTAPNSPPSDPVLFDIPQALPALLRAHKIGEKTERLNFDWPHVSAVMEKVDEELAELKQALAQESPERQAQELGDLLFSLAQLARHLKVDPEQSLRQTNQRFERRFHRARQLAAQQQLNWMDLSEEQLESLWQQAKLSE